MHSENGQKPVPLKCERWAINIKNFSHSQRYASRKNQKQSWHNPGQPLIPLFIVGIRNMSHSKYSKQKSTKNKDKPLRKASKPPSKHPLRHNEIITWFHCPIEQVEIRRKSLSFTDWNTFPISLQMYTYLALQNSLRHKFAWQLLMSIVLQTG